MGHPSSAVATANPGWALAGFGWASAFGWLLAGLLLGFRLAFGWISPGFRLDSGFWLSFTKILAGFSWLRVDLKLILVWFDLDFA